MAAAAAAAAAAAMTATVAGVAVAGRMGAGVGGAIMTAPAVTGAFFHSKQCAEIFMQRQVTV